MTNPELIAQLRLLKERLRGSPVNDTAITNGIERKVVRLILPEELALLETAARRLEHLETVRSGGHT